MAPVQCEWESGGCDAGRALRSFASLRYEYPQCLSVLRQFLFFFLRFFSQLGREMNWDISEQNRD